MKRITILFFLIFIIALSACSSQRAIQFSTATVFLKLRPSFTPVPSVTFELTPTAIVYQTSVPTFTNLYTSAGITDDQAKVIDKGAQAFLDAVKSGDKTSLAEMMDYPLSTDINGIRTQIMSENEFIAKYDLIFPDSFKAGLARATIINNMEGNWSGVFMLIHNGQVWFNTDGKIPSISWWGG